MRRTLLWVLAAVAGVLLVAGVTYAASSLTTQTVGLSSEPVSADEQLVPAATASPTPTPTPKPKPKKKKRPKPTPTATPTAVPTAAPTVDDHGGDDDNSGHGSDDSGGDDHSGHGGDGDDD